MIKDAFCQVVKVGDKVAYAPGGAGAQGFYTGTVEKVTAKGITIVGHGELDCMNSPKVIRRNSGCFVIYNEPATGTVNAWNSLDKHLKGLDGIAGKIRDEVSAELFRDGCHSAATHHKRFVDRLVEELEEVADDC